jgi:hypothetical protein
VLALFIIELIVSHKCISWFFKEIFGPSGPKDVQCYAGYKTPNLNPSRIISEHQYPSYGIFSLTAIATYLGLSTYEFSETMQLMGPQWEGRAVISGIFIIALLFGFIMIRLILCESLGEVVIAMFFAITCGGIFFKINTTFFGKESINFLGLPFLESKDKNGNNIYICNGTDPIL